MKRLKHYRACLKSNGTIRRVGGRFRARGEGAFSLELSTVEGGVCAREIPALSQALRDKQG